MGSPKPYQEQRAEMVRQQLRKRNIRQQAVLDAFLRVPRERFVPEEYRPHTYEDRPLPIGSGATISQPFVVAWMLSLLELEPTDRVLEVGSGSGYVLALLSQIVADVFGIERIEALAAAAKSRLASLGSSAVQLKWDDGHSGWPEYAPFNKILVSAGGPAVPDSLKKQLAVGGRLLLPIGDEPKKQKLLQIDRLSQEEFQTKNLGRVSFVPLLPGVSAEIHEM